MTNQIHPFEASGLGKAPFRCTGIIGHKRVAGSCDYCGTGIADFFIIVGSDGATFKVGCDCVAKVDQAMYQERAAEIRMLRKGRSQERKRESRKAQAAQFLLDHPGLEAALNYDHHISQDLKSNLSRWGSLSDAQIALAYKLVVDGEARKARDAQMAAALVSALPWVAGTLTVTGKVLHVKTEEGFYGTTHKMLVQLPDGKKCWGSVPSSLYADVQNGYQGSVQGSTVTFTATFEPKQGDDKFAWFKRPRKASRLPEAGS